MIRIETHAPLVPALTCFPPSVGTAWFPESMLVVPVVHFKPDPSTFPLREPYRPPTNFVFAETGGDRCLRGRVHLIVGLVFDLAEGRVAAKRRLQRRKRR